ncbi:MAG TPA: GNAT family N-acetyltransferase [Bryobacteraceae bacterium]|nr:GNAT family N-acetyltransferase [Bryobacteraceae bacterium]
MNQGPAVLLRRATPEDAPRVAEIWHSGWRDGHLGGVPEALVVARTPESFFKRAVARFQSATVAEVDGVVAGFIMVEADEVEQVYVAAEHRGTGIAQLLLTEAERQVAENGFEEAWLAAVDSNARARAFYSRAGWVDRGTFEYQAPTERGPISVPSHRYTKNVGQRS